MKREGSSFATFVWIRNTGQFLAVTAPCFLEDCGNERLSGHAWHERVRARYELQEQVSGPRSRQAA